MKKSSIVKSVTIVASGASLSRFIVIIFSPIVTRLYGPEAFGVLGVFISFTEILIPIVALSYPIAIVLPKNTHKAIDLAMISLIISLFISLFVLIVLFYWGDSITSFFQIKELLPYIFIIPVMLIFATCMRILKQWLIRTKYFHIVSISEFVTALFINSLKVVVGLILPVAITLIILTTLNKFIHALLLFLGIILFIKHKSRLDYSFSFKKICEVAIEYKEFPLFRSPQVFISALSRSMPVLLLSIFFSPVFAGYYTLGFQVLQLPSAIIGRSIGEVVYPHMAEMSTNKKAISRLLVRSTVFLVLIGIVPFGIIILFGPQLFGLIFGNDWVSAGEFGRWIALLSFFVFINRPSISAIPVLKIQKQFLFHEIISIILKLGVFVLGVYVFNDAYLSVMLFSIITAILNIILVIYVLFKSYISSIKII